MPPQTSAAGHDRGPAQPTVTWRATLPPLPAEVLADAGVSCKFRRLGLPDVYVTKIGCQRWLCEEYGIGPTGIKKAICEALGR